MAAGQRPVLTPEAVIVHGTTAEVVHQRAGRRVSQLFVPGGPGKSVVSWGKGRCVVGWALLGGRPGLGG